MYDDLIVVTCPRTAEAMMAWVRLQLMHESLPLGMDKALLLSVNERGKVYTMQVSDLANFPLCREARFLGSLIRRIIDRDGELAGQRLIDAGIEETFLRGLSKALTAGGSAIVFYAPVDGFIDVSQLLAVLSQERGTLHHTTLTPATAETILELEIPN
jgi:uncharacterized membrane protein